MFLFRLQRKKKRIFDTNILSAKKSLPLVSQVNNIQLILKSKAVYGRLEGVRCVVRLSVYLEVQRTPQLHREARHFAHLAQKGHKSVL